MRHVGEEGALGPVGALGCQPGLLHLARALGDQHLEPVPVPEQLALHPLALGDVARRQHRAHDRAVRVADRPEIDAPHPRLARVPATEAVLDVGLDVAAQGPAHAPLVQGHRRAIGVGEVEHGPVVGERRRAVLLAREPVERREGVVEVVEPPLGVGDQHGVPHAGQRRLELGVGLPQLLLRAPPLGPGAHHPETEAEVRGEILEVGQLGVVEGGGVGAGDHEHAEDLITIEEGQRAEAREVEAARVGAPLGEDGDRLNVPHHHGPARADRGPGRARPRRVVGPGQAAGVEGHGADPQSRHHPQGSRLVLFGERRHGKGIDAVGRDEIADLLQERRLVGGADQLPLAVAQQAELALRASQVGSRLRRRLLQVLRRVAHGRRRAYASTWTPRRGPQRRAPARPSRNVMSRSAYTAR